MKLYTETKIEQEEVFSYDDSLLALGSCFAERLGSRLAAYKFDIVVNPVGTIYNPLSLCSLLDRAMEGTVFGDDDALEYAGLWHNLSLGSLCSELSQEALVSQSNHRLSCLRERLQTAQVLLITWGTAWVYKFLAQDRLVANCNKIPAAQFDRFRLSPTEIVAPWEQVIEKLKNFNPSLRILFTISPVRHLKDGSHGNQLSKSTLLLACDSLCQSFKQVAYFPAYELLLDDLRDYRFYDRDLVHPNDLAVEYISERFIDTYFSSDTQAIMQDIMQLKRALAHRPLHAEDPAHSAFLVKQAHLLERLQKEHPAIDFSEEWSCLSSQKVE